MQGPVTPMRQRRWAEIHPGRALVVAGVGLVAAILAATAAAIWFGWHRHAAFFGIGGGASALLVFVLLVGLSRQLSRQQLLTAALSASEQRFRDFTEASSDWIWEMGPDMRFTYVSERFFEVTGTPVSQLVGRTRREVIDLPAEDPVWQVHFDDLQNHRPFRGFTYPHRNHARHLPWIPTSANPPSAPAAP